MPKELVDLSLNNNSLLMRTILRHRLTVLLLFAPIFPLNKFLALKEAFFLCWKEAEFFFRTSKAGGEFDRVGEFLGL